MHNSSVSVADWQLLQMMPKYCKSASEYLQTEHFDIGCAAAAVADLTTKLRNMRNDEQFHQYYEIAQAKVEEVATCTDFTPIETSKRSR